MFGAFTQTTQIRQNRRSIPSHSVSVDVNDLYAAGMGCDEVDGFLTAIADPRITDDRLFIPDEPLHGIRLKRFRAGVGIAIRWRILVANEQRMVRTARSSERTIAGIARMVTSRHECVTDVILLLKRAIGRRIVLQ